MKWSIDAIGEPSGKRPGDTYAYARSYSPTSVRIKHTWRPCREDECVRKDYRTAHAFIVIAVLFFNGQHSYRGQQPYARAREQRLPRKRNYTAAPYKNTPLHRAVYTGLQKQNDRSVRRGANVTAIKTDITFYNGYCLSVDIEITENKNSQSL